MKLTSSVQECIAALANGGKVYAKNRMGDWIEVDEVYENGSAKVADSLSGFNSDTIGRVMTVGNLNIDLDIRDLEVQ